MSKPLTLHVTERRAIAAMLGREPPISFGGEEVAVMNMANGRELWRFPVPASPRKRRTALGGKPRLG